MMTDAERESLRFHNLPDPRDVQIETLKQQLSNYCKELCAVRDELATKTVELDQARREVAEATQLKVMNTGATVIYDALRPPLIPSSGR